MKRLKQYIIADDKISELEDISGEIIQKMEEMKMENVEEVEQRDIENRVGVGKIFL